MLPAIPLQTAFIVVIPCLVTGLSIRAYLVRQSCLVAARGCYHSMPRSQFRDIAEFSSFLKQNQDPALPDLPALRFRSGPDPCVLLTGFQKGSGIIRGGNVPGALPLLRPSVCLPCPFFAHFPSVQCGPLSNRELFAQQIVSFR